MHVVLRELRLAFRRLRHSPGFAITAVLMLALGIGATVTIFSVVNGVLLKPLPYTHSQQLVDVREVVEEWSGMYPSFPANPKHFGLWRQRATAFSGWALLQRGASPRFGTLGLIITAALMRASVKPRPAIGKLWPLTACVVTAPNEWPDIPTCARSSRPLSA